MNKLLYITFLIGFSLNLCNPIFGQEAEIKKSTVIRTDGTKKYFIHTVEAKQTLYSIAKGYGVSVSEITFENTSTVANGLKIGDEIKIPCQPTAIGEPSSTSIATQKADVHTVVSGETLYGIAKSYNILLEDLIKLNPETELGLRPGQILRIQNSSEDINPKPLNENAVVTNVVDKSGINFVTMLLPFYLNEYTFDDSVETKISDNSHNAIEFYQGALLAIDSLKKMGISFNISVYDVVSDTSSVKQILNKANVKNSNLIIGPFYNSTFEAVARFAKMNKTPLVSPMIQNSKILIANPTVSKVVPNNTSQCEAMASYIAANYKDCNLILVHTNQNAELNLLNAFKTKFKLDLPQGAFKEVNYKTESFSGVQNGLKPIKQNIVVVFSSEQVMVSQLLPKLDGKREDFKIIVFGQAIWKNFENIEADVFSKLNLHLPANYYLDYEQTDVKNFIRKYRDQNQAEPSQMSFLGYDICYYYLNLLNNRGTNFHTTLWQTKGKGLSTGFDFFRDNAEKGYENKSVSIVKYEDNRLVKVN